MNCRIKSCAAANELLLVVAITGFASVYTHASASEGEPVRIEPLIARAAPNERTSNQLPSFAVDGDPDTYTWSTESGNTAQPSYLAVFPTSQVVVERLRLWKDSNGGGGPSTKNLTIQYTSDVNPDAASGTWMTVTNLTNGYLGQEMLVATAVNSNGTVEGDVHDSVNSGHGWASLTFDPVSVTGVRIAFGAGGGFNHYKVHEIEVYTPGNRPPVVTRENGWGEPVIIVSDVGDADGFNGVYAAGTQTLPFRFQFENMPLNAPDDPAHTDQNWFHESSGVSYAHVLGLSPDAVILSAEYEIVTYDNAGQIQYTPAHNGRILLDGLELRRHGQDFFFDAVGEEFGGASGTFGDGAAELFRADIPPEILPALADGSVLVSYRDSGTSSDAVAVDYSRVIIAGTVPPRLAECGTPVTLTASANDPDGDELTVTWRVDEAVEATYQAPATAALQFEHSYSVGEHTVSLTVTDGHESVTWTTTMSISDTTAPIGSAGPDDSVPEGSVVLLDGSGSLDGCGTLAAYAWTQIAGPSVILHAASTTSPSFTAPEVPIGGAVLTFQLVVSDGLNTSDPDVVNVTVTNVNHAPVALAGDDLCQETAVAEGGLAALDGSNSYDEDDEPLTYAWAQTGGTPVALDLTDPVRPTFIAPLVGSTGETLTFELIVRDGLDSASDTVDVCVENVNHAPIADAGQPQTVAEGSPVALDASGSSDPDGDDLIYAWTQVSGPAVTLSSDASPTPSFAASLLDVDTTLTFRVRVADGFGGSDEDEVTVTVQDTNSPPACELARPSDDLLWPPNHKLVPVTIQGVSDPENADVQITILGVTQDEPLSGLGDGDTGPDAVIQGSTVLLRAERAAGGNGRVYRIAFRADDGFGGFCSGTVSVTVPHDKGRNKPPAVDDGQNYDSLGP